MSVQVGLYPDELITTEPRCKRRPVRLDKRDHTVMHRPGQSRNGQKESQKEQYVLMAFHKKPLSLQTILHI
jgi:hypothetical protein